MEHTFTFNTRYYFGNWAQKISWILGTFIVGLFIPTWYWTPLWVLACVFIVTARYQVYIDLKNKYIDDYLLIFGTKSQREKFPFTEIECIYLTLSSYSQQFNHRSISSTVKGTIFNAYLKTDRHSIYIGESKNLNRLRSHVQPLAKGLQLQVDNITGHR